MLRRLRIENLVLIRDAEFEFCPGLNVVTGETGAGKTIFAQAIGLLLGNRGDAALIGPAAAEAYVEAELDLPDGLLDEEGLEGVAGLAPDDEPGLVLARRVFADGRSRAYAFGRALAREDAAAVAERLIAMSGQFEQRRLARSAHQLDLLDAFAGEEQLRRRGELAAAWRALQEARRRRDELARHEGDREARAAELRALVQCVAGLAADSEETLRAERERLRNAVSLGEAAMQAAEAIAPEQGEAPGAGDLAALAERALRPAVAVDPSLAEAADDVSDLADRLRERASSLRAYVSSLQGDPGRLDEIEAALERIGDAKRRFSASTLSELLERAEDARSELDLVDTGDDPLTRAEAELAGAAGRFDEHARAVREARLEAAAPFADVAREELGRLGLGDGELEVELSDRADGPTGRDEMKLLVRPNAGLPLAPVATTASGGELSRIALALRAVAHARAGEPTIVFDEIDAGIGGTTAHAVAESLRRLAEGSQVIAITHLAQIASAADRHFRVEKVPGDPTHTRIELLEGDARGEELERMLGGEGFLVGAGFVRPGDDRAGR